jgi:TfoX/Sxy family transcriptional regulator of competence genes
MEMAYDEETAARFRDMLGGMVGVTEKRMMGGVCFMVSGNMVGGAHREKTGERLFMFRVGKDSMQQALAMPHARPVQMGSRAPMQGFVFVEADAVDDEALRSWLSLALSHVSTLSPK